MSEKLLDSIRCGLITTEELEAKPYGFRVNWIHWDSGFRGTDLRISDRVIAVDGVRYDVSNRAQQHTKAVGCYAEDQYWDSIGAKDGRMTTLIVDRDGDTLEIVGTVRAERIYTADDGRKTLGNGGPPILSNDGFDDPWSMWLEKFVGRTSRVLDGGWRLSAFNSRNELAEFMDDKDRIEMLVKKYPGAFTTETKADWETVVGSLKGTKYDVTAADLGYRSASAHRVDDVIAAAKTAQEDFLARNPAVSLDSLPPTDAIRGDRKAIAGKIVVLPPITDIISEAGHGWYCVGGNGETLVPMDMESKQMSAILNAVYRYQQIVAPNVEETHEMIVRLTETPKMVATPRAVYTGILAEVIADTVGGKVFVDASGPKADLRFAAEEKMLKLPSVVVRDDLGPAEVMNSFIAALKLNSMDLWSGFFATWSCIPIDDGRYAYSPDDAPSPETLSIEWVHARKIIVGIVYDVRVAHTGKTRVLLNGTETPGGPKVEAVTIEMDPIGVFDGEYRAFKNVEVHRVWQLQRVNGGPWRITSVQGI